MQKTMKIVSVLLVVMMLLFTVSTVVNASDIGSVLDKMDEGKDQVGDKTDSIATIGGQFAGILTTIGMVIAVLVLLVLGIKYMMGSASEKAEYKKTMIPYVIGAILILGASAIVKAIFSFTFAS